MSRAKLNSIDQHAASMRRALWIGLLLFLVAAPAQANRIVQIRVGQHPTFTRLVFEMDAFTGYQVERRAGTDGTGQLTVTLEASTPPREIRSKSVGIESVRVVERAGQAIAKIRLRKSDFQMKEMILSNPPRIVLDFVHSAAAVAKLTGDPYAKPAPVEPPVRAKPPPAVVRPDPKPVVVEVIEPDPVIPQVIEPEPEPVVAKVVQPEPATDEIAMVDPTTPLDDAERRTALGASIPDVQESDDSKLQSDPAAESPSEPVADAADADLEAPLGSSTRASTPSTDETQRRMPSPSDVTRRIEKPKPDGWSLPFDMPDLRFDMPDLSFDMPDLSFDMPDLPFDMVTMAGIAVGALIVLVVAVLLFRRRSLPNDLDVTDLADESDDDAAAFDRETSDRIRADGSAMKDSPTGRPVPQLGEQNTAAYSLSEVAAKATEPDTGWYNEDSVGEKPMDMETADLPTKRGDFSVPPAAVMSGDDSNLSQLVQDLASRVGNLETRLNEANDSREKLERQVAAQSEELRVQRAAIARTQRALRSLSRSEEDQATEPALREPSQPAR
ncbi:MAG: hypothetical protein ACE1ZP_06815 [Myxococcota bacterium]